MSNYDEKVKTLLENVHKNVVSYKQSQEDYVNSLINAQERGEISGLKFCASQDGLRATFRLNEQFNVNLRLA